MAKSTVLDFDGSQDDLEALLTAGLSSPEMAEDEFWNSVNQRTDALLFAYKSGPHKT